MAEKVVKLGLPRDNNFMYYIKSGAVWRVPRKQPGHPKGRPERVHEAGIEQDTAFIYFLDKDGDVARAKRAIGGQKRKKPAAKAAKTAKKPAAKKPAKKAAPKAKAKPTKAAKPKKPVAKAKKPVKKVAKRR
ncbi:MAG: hypothetical protein V2A73_22755 [Pseudomonadota bacterium]